MPGSDGAVVIDVKLTANDAEKELGRLKREVLKLEEALSFKGAKLDNLTKELETARAKLAELQSQIKVDPKSGKFLMSAETATQISDLKTSIQQMETEQEKLTGEIEETNQKLAATKRRYGEVAEQAKALPSEGKRIEGLLDRIGKRLGRLASRVLFFSVVTAGLRALKNWMTDVVKTDQNAVAAIAQLKGALLTLAQPLVDVVIPAFTTFVQVLTQVVSALASVVSAIFGTTVEESAEAAENLNDEKKALDGVGASAKKAGKSLASFDEINKLGGDSANAGGGSKSSEIAPDFSGNFGQFDEMMEKLGPILKLVEAIGIGLLAWKIASGFGADLQTAAGIAVFAAGAFEFLVNWLDALENGVDWDNLTGMILGLGLAIVGLLIAFGPTAAAIAAVVGGLALFAVSMKDAFENGVSWPNAIGMVLGLAAAVAGLYILFGPVAAGIALVVGGIAMLVFAFHDVVENGWNVQNTFLAIAGLLATGLGFFFITGSVIPLVIGAIASLLLAITVATGHGEELIQGIQTIIQGFLDFFTGIFTGDMEKAVGGIEKIFEGLGTVVHAVIDGVKDFFLGFLDWLDEKTGGKFSDIIQAAKDIVTGFFDQIKDVADGLILALKGVVEFLTGVFTADFDLAWQGIKDIFKGVVNAILGFWVGGVNLMIKALNFVIDKLNGLSFTMPDWVPGVGGEKFGVSLPRLQEYQIPKLATGAVIPPNREFMAVLGDQSSGNNLEAPEELLRQIVREEGGGNYASILQQILDAIRDGKVMVVDGDAFARVVNETNSRESSRRGAALVNIW